MCGLSVLTMNGFDIEERVERAVKNFMSGYNCAQSVFLAYSDLFGLDMEIAKSVSVSFGGGMGRMREVCGTVSAMAMLAGFKYPVAEPSDQEARTRNYAVVQSLAKLSRSSSAQSSAVNCFLLRKHPNTILLRRFVQRNIMPNVLAHVMSRLRHV